jgi:hypothetical protein
MKKVVVRDLTEQMKILKRHSDRYLSIKAMDLNLNLDKETVRKA